MSKFTKPALTSAQHVAQWQQRGLVVPDQVKAIHYLDVISYYRLSAYTLPFQNGNPDHVFRANVGFDDVLNLYVFDRELRLLLLDAIERIEVALRASMTNVLAVHHGPHAYLNAGIFDTRYNHKWLIEQIEKKCDEPKVEIFIEHYRKNYSDPALPPVWMVMEILTFKEVSVLFAYLSQQQDKQALSKFWGLHDTLLRSWFRAISDLRNLCAHHSRVWNREFGSRPQLPRRALPDWPNLSRPLRDQYIDPTRRLYMLLVVIRVMLQRVNPESTWHARLKDLLDEHPGISRAHMGMPDDWYNDPFWGVR